MLLCVMCIVIVFMAAVWPIGLGVGLTVDVP
jgi:hypothetical protein